MEDKYKLKFEYEDSCCGTDFSVNLEFAGSLDDLTIDEFWRYCRRMAAAMSYTEEQIDTIFGADY